MQITTFWQLNIILLYRNIFQSKQRFCLIMAGYSIDTVVPSPVQKLKKTRRTSLFPDFDRLCCSTRIEQAHQPAAFTGVTATELRAKAESLAKSTGAAVFDRRAFVETAAGGSHAPDGWHGGGSWYRPDAMAVSPGNQIGHQSYMPGHVSQSFAYGVDTNYSFIENPYEQTGKQQYDPYHSSNYHQHGPSFGQAVQSPSRVVEHPQFFGNQPSAQQSIGQPMQPVPSSPTRGVEYPQFFEGDPSFVPPSYGHPMQPLAHFEQTQFFAPPHSHKHSKVAPLSIANLTSFDEQTQQFVGGSPKFEHQSFQKTAPPPTPIYNTQEYIHDHGLSLVIAPTLVPPETTAQIGTNKAAIV